MAKTLRHALVVFALVLASSALLPYSSAAQIAVSGLTTPEICNGNYTNDGLVNGKNRHIKGPCVIEWQGTFWKIAIPSVLDISAHATDCGLDPPNSGWSDEGGGVPTLTGGCEGSVTRYVATDGIDTGDCTDQADPCLTLAYAVGQANNGDTIDLAPGTYNEPGLVIDKALNIVGQGVVVQ